MLRAGRSVAWVLLGISASIGSFGPAAGAEDEFRMGWLEPRHFHPDGELLYVLRNPTRMPLRYTVNGIGPSYVLYEWTEGTWRAMALPADGDGDVPKILGPGDSVEVRVILPGVGWERRGPVRVGVALRRIDSRQWFTALSPDTVTVSYAPRRDFPISPR